jgi:hypothetical protein
MTLPTDASWLHKFCRSGESSWLSTPFSFQMKTVGHGLGLWAAASDGRVMVAVEGASHFDEVDSKHREVVIELLNPGTPDKEKLPARRLSLPQFAAWCGKPDWTPPSLCDVCTGRRSVSCSKCKGTGDGHEVACSECGKTHVCRCPDCDRGITPCETCEGTGTKDAIIPVNYGRIGRVIINRQYVARAFQFLSGGTKESRVANIFAGEESKAAIVECGPVTQPDRVLISGPDWRLTIMGHRLPDENALPVYEYAKLPVEKKDEDIDIPF